MHNQNNPMNEVRTSQFGANQPMSKNHGGHELFDAHEVISGVIGLLDQYRMYDQHIQDSVLKDILQRQSSFVTQMYNTMVECFQTGQDPAVPTQQYQMTQSNEVIYGMQPSQPAKPIQSVNELTDQELSSFMLGQTKTLASSLATAALEVTNPVLRRVFADSIPNVIELSYELFLYQNKQGYYQVPQLNDQDMNLIMQSYTSAPQQNQQH